MASPPSPGNLKLPMEPDKFLDMMCKKNKIVLISATYCTFCTKIKMLLVDLKERFVSLEIDLVPRGRELFKEVVSRSKSNTVPQVFVRGKYLGGYDDMISLHRRGELQQLLS